MSSTSLTDIQLAELKKAFAVFDKDVFESLFSYFDLVAQSFVRFL